MASLVPALDRLLGPLAPGRQAARSAPKPLSIVVFAASGDQGRSACHSLVADGGFVVTGITEEPFGEVAVALKHEGVKIVKGKMDDPGSYTPYLEGMDGAFVNADFLNSFHHLGPNLPKALTLEIKQSIQAVEACGRAGIKHVVYSALDDLPEEVEVPHCASKAAVVKHIRTSSLPATILYPSHPFSDLIAWDLLRERPRFDGQGSGGPKWYVLAVPAPDECEIPGYAVEQIGDWVKVAFQKPGKWIGQDMKVCGEILSVEEMAKHLSKISKKQVETLHLTKEEFYQPKHRARVGDAMWAQYRACLEDQFVRDESKSEAIVPHQWRFVQWAGQSKDVHRILEF
ncbi:hypothetical protein EHS25_007427 [Saitozyma podzolica]|uniref:NmrA-like domain-containing protein n=1 Tax=Saitozyma podzolica TaxID=1890683 RepID=A0A427YPN0_9TREE|nr:hypothetical protein EHS25_007427 [Saitozyma podzolica]